MAKSISILFYNSLYFQNTAFGTFLVKSLKLDLYMDYKVAIFLINRIFTNEAKIFLHEFVTLNSIKYSHVLDEFIMQLDQMHHTYIRYNVIHSFLIFDRNRFLATNTLIHKFSSIKPKFTMFYLCPLIRSIHICSNLPWKQ